jgi:hypothetical protein
MKTTSSEHVVYINCLECQNNNKKLTYVHNIFCAFSFHARTGKSINNIFSYFGLVDARASDKDLPVCKCTTKESIEYRGLFLIICSCTI